MTSAHVKQIIAVAITGCLALLFWMSVITPVAAWKERQFSHLSDKKTQLQRLEQSIFRLKDEQRQLSQKDTLDVAWAAERMGEATARIQSAINTIARTNGLSLRSVTPTSPRELPFAHSAGFRIEAEVHLDKLTGFLRELEFNTPALVVDRATLRRLNRLGEATEQPVLYLQTDLIAPVRLTGEEDQ